MTATADSSATEETAPREPAAGNENFVDYYELLMVSPRADRGMIELAARLMLTRFGPKNPKTADPAKVKLVELAFRTLADPDKRNEYDAELQERAPAGSGDNGNVFEAGIGALKAPKSGSTLSREHVEHQKRLREGVIGALYDVIINRPRHPELGRAEIAKAIGHSSDDLEFAMWFLRERGFLRTTAQGAYSITAEGALWAENGGLPQLSPAQSDPSGGWAQEKAQLIAIPQHPDEAASGL